MSRYSIPAKDDQHSVVVGWDAPMTTFFAQVEDLTIDEKDEQADPIVLWVGDTDRAVPTIDALESAIAAYATIPDEVLEQLQADYDQPWSPSSLQVSTRHLMATIRETLPSESCSIENLEPLHTELTGKTVWVVCELVNNRWNPDGARATGTIIRVVRALNPKFQTLMIESDAFERPEPFSLDRQGVLWDVTD